MTVPDYDPTVKLVAKSLGISEEDALERIMDLTQEWDIFQYLGSVAKRLGVKATDLIKAVMQDKTFAKLVAFAVFGTANLYTKPGHWSHCVTTAGKNMSLAALVNDALPDGIVGDLFTAGAGAMLLIDSTLACVGMGSMSDVNRAAADEASKIDPAAVAVNAVADGVPEGLDPEIKKRVDSAMASVVAIGNSMKTAGPLFSYEWSRIAVELKAPKLNPWSNAMLDTAAWIVYYIGRSGWAKSWYSTFGTTPVALVADAKVPGSDITAAAYYKVAADQFKEYGDGAAKAGAEFVAAAITHYTTTADLNPFGPPEFLS